MSSATATRRLTCRQCERRFTRPENLARHMKTHDTVQKHCCQTCGRQFTRSDLRRKHELLHSRSAPTRAKAKAKSGSATLNQDAQPHDVVPPLPPGFVMETNNNQDDDAVPFASRSRTAPRSLSSAPSAEPNTYPVHIDTMNLDGITEMYFDYESFARPWDYDIEQIANSSGWFSEQFFAAIRETEFAYSPSFQSWGDESSINPLPNDVSIASLAHGESSLSQTHFDQDTYHGNADRIISNASLVSGTGNTSRAPSPPNERSLEDQMPFAWDPRSRSIARAQPVSVRPDDPILATADPRLRVSEEALIKLRHFLHHRASSSSEDDAFTIPSLALINVFTSLYFKHFSSQAPVLHMPTLEINALPPALLAIIMVIGSTYSRLRHTRRFGIVLFDRIRRNIQYDIEHDNSLMRDPHFVLAVSLVCFMGLWCGNKRAFELGEALQSVIITYIRHLPDKLSSAQSRDSDRSSQALNCDDSLQHRWSRWITDESVKRIRWFVYTLDSQFCSLLGVRNLMVLSEIRRWEMPCDDAFWAAPSAKSWKSLLGSASQPSCPVFGPIAATLLAPIDSSSQSFSSGSFRPPYMSDWCAYILLAAVVSEVFNIEQRTVVSQMLEVSYPESCQLSEQPRPEVRLRRSLLLWYDAFHHRTSSNYGQTYFQRASNILYYLAQIYTRLKLTDIQDCIGKSGSADATGAFGHLRTWVSLAPEEAYSVVKHASACVTYVIDNNADAAPYDLIGLFLCHLAIWILANAANSTQKHEYMTKLRAEVHVSDNVIAFIEAGFAHRDTPNIHEPKLILRHAIQSLVQRGTWGASSNLALLLHLHPGVVAT